MSNDQAVRSQLRKSLQGGNAYDRLVAILGEIPPERRFDVPSGCERSAWQILDHMRRTLEDLIAFSDNSAGTYQGLEWPKDYWPAEPDPRDPGAWDQSRQRFFEAQGKLEELVEDRDRDLTAAFPWGDGQTLLHEVLLAIQHTSYHAGELVELARVLGPLGPGAL